MITATPLEYADPKTILQGHQAHENCPDTIYIKGDEPYIVPMLMAQQLSAAVIPSNVPQIDKEAANAITPAQIGLLEEIEDFSVIDGTIKYGSGLDIPPIPDVVCQRMTQMAELLERNRPDGENIYMRILANRPGMGFKGEEPNFHRDFFVAHSTVYGAPLEHRNGFFKQHDTIMFGNGLLHKSSQFIPEQGQVAVIGTYDPR